MIDINCEIPKHLQGKIFSINNEISLVVMDDCRRVKVCAMLIGKSFVANHLYRKSLKPYAMNFFNPFRNCF